MGTLGVAMCLAWPPSSQQRGNLIAPIRDDHAKSTGLFKAKLYAKPICTHITLTRVTPESSRNIDDGR
ncbi:hypothetical protein PF005_g13429 [Phytophthora fragariae]|uniref:Uncharacterized protein n=1 Tax=Phytophthora fragariae TaxID=53985 RepID=A0A6A3RY08_9STRA|nr:hypothetical protein PF003_g12872 [Phytophthora fragariae]KAE8935301.1 hypothetical protein PF009_g14738 [Phytophthora fragariae]KAE9006113.1 hypothetical protein PF011_g11747 [Phytophthora fragariae]KAE9105091.1 hypothetical protein PF010_g13145 [Phytophthora fragariae]KAE9105110.1 hypothetical protein PF007_g13814 [Phytophthora fragariae]